MSLLFGRRTNTAPATPPTVITLPAGPVEGVPPFLQHTLQPWLIDSIQLNPEFGERIHLQLRGGSIEGDDMLVAVEALLKLWDGAGQDEGGPDWFTSGFSVWRPDGRGSLREWRARVDLLDRILTDAGSVWRVCPRPLSLQRRIDPADVSAAQAAVQSGSASPRPAAGADLASAWAAAYGRSPNPSEAYRLAVRAVEHVAVPVVSPKDSSGTLGKARAVIAQSPARWRVNVGNGLGGDTLAQMIGALWHGQEDRHGGQEDFTTVTQDQAEDAVQLAVLLVRWFADGRVQRVP